MRRLAHLAAYVFFAALLAAILAPALEPAPVVSSHGAQCRGEARTGTSLTPKGMQ